MAASGKATDGVPSRITRDQSAMTQIGPVAVGRECLVYDSENGSSRATVNGSLNGRHRNPTAVVYRPNTVAPWALHVNTAGLIVGKRLDIQASDVRGPLSRELG
jgi:hypothetical protein